MTPATHQPSAGGQVHARVEIDLGERSYPILIGSSLLDDPATWSGLPKAASALIVTNETVGPLYAARLQQALSQQYPQIHVLSLPDGEAYKTWDSLNLIFDALLSHGCDRKTVLFALGGGVVGDMTGFAAACYMRGVPFVQVPTTLLAQVDSSVGGKTAINARQGKNLIGLFHQPRIVIADTKLLSTLPRRELLAGYAEVAKYGALGDADFFEWLETSGPKALAGDEAAMVRCVAHSCQMKADIVARDERETGDRALLNLGHTFGHALEAATGFSDRLVHGEGVAIGMALAFKLSVRLGLCPGQDAQRFTRHLQAVGLPSTIADIPGARASAEELIGHMAHDKKVADGKLTFILLHGLGQAFVTRDVPLDAVKSVLADG